MKFQEVADSIKAMTCIVSVEKLEDGGYGKIRLVTGNKAYIDSIEHPMDGMAMLHDKFIPNSEYTEYLPRDLNFEDYCYRAAVEKKCLHSYAHPDRFDFWFNMTFMPLWPDDGNICYCTYSMEVNFEADTSRISNLSGDIAAAVLENCITLRGASDFRKAMDDVVKSIRLLCKAERCCVMIMDHESKKCDLLGYDCSDEIDKNMVSEAIHDSFYGIAATWESTVISGSNCLIAKNPQDMVVVKERNPEWYASLKRSGVETIVLFPLKSRTELLGYMWAVNFDSTETPKIKEALESTTFVLSSEIENYLLLDKLKVLSSRDMLTGVNNRNEMNSIVDKYANATKAAKGALGVVFVDINGLKNINDVEGHEAGDMLLKRAANALCEVFDWRDIYRAGGDEFAIILPDVTEEKLVKFSEDIKVAANRYEGVSFAVGHCMTDEKNNIHDALHVADERMYEDKKKYYEAHPDKLRGAAKDKYRISGVNK
ncbi:MAG: GGDEF domain-containing protein [Butyrivibrio sp.]|nr:GGDEF domain-containing protein [Butyrivibrio sp.]